MATEQFEERGRKLRQQLGRQPARALWLTHLPDVQYLTGFTGSNALVIVLPRSTILLTDGRYSTQAKEQTADAAVQVFIGKQLILQACKLLLRGGVEQVLFDGGHTTVAQLAQMQSAWQESLVSKAASGQRRRFFVPFGSSPVEALREIKDAQEVAHMEQAALLGCRLFEEILPHVRPGVSERTVAAELEYAARRHGADSMSFETIVASGVRSALPHGHATDQPLPERGFVTLDFGVILRGYCSDMTRTVCIGKPTREERAAYAAVLAAEQAGVAAVSPGAKAGAVDRAARSTLRRHGLARYFTHSTGHGLGLEIHEGPRLGAKVEQVLAEGMVLTVEPGVYQPNHFGVRIEDMVVVEAQGGRVLTPATTELLSL